MPRCADCGHPNRPGVRFCTHCGKPAAASEAATKGPTAVVAVAVLAVGLFAFLNIRPMAPHEPKTATVQVAMPVVESPGAATNAPPALEPPAEAPGAAAAVPVIELSREPAAALPASDPSREAAAALPAPDFAPDVLESPDLVLPAAAPLATPAMPAPPPSQTAPSPAPRKEAALRMRASPTPVSPTPVSPASVSSSPTPRQPAHWLQGLRAELAACEGDFFARTICREAAKFRHCASAGAWGKVPECPAARLPDLANFN